MGNRVRRASLLFCLGSIWVSIAACGGSGPAVVDAPLADVQISMSQANFGFVVCSPRALHRCSARLESRHGVRVFAETDILPATDCAQLEQAAVSACGSSADLSHRACLLQRGVMHDMLATWDESAEPPPHPQRFKLRCDEGHTEIDYIQPI